MRRIMAAVGGTRKAAAAAAGIPYSTWGHLMGAKRHASAANVRKIESAFARLVMAPAMAAKIKAKGYPKEIWIKAVVVADPEGERYINGYGRSADSSKEAVYGVTAFPAYRTFKAGKDTDLDTRAVVHAWLSRGPDAAADALGDAIQSAYGNEFGFEGNHVDVELHGKQ